MVTNNHFSSAGGAATLSVNMSMGNMENMGHQHQQHQRNLNRFQHMSRLVDEDESPFLMEGIKYPGKNDVMLGRGGESTYHCGNISFRQLVEDHKNKYYTAPRANKSRVVAEVVRKWRAMSPPGRFLTRTSPGTGDESSWHDVGDRRALKKASHSLRDAVRCYTQEKREREQQKQTTGSSSSSNSKSEEDEEYDDDGDDCELQPTAPKKRSRDDVVILPERSTSNSKSCGKGGRDATSEYVAVYASKKHGLIPVESASNKRRKVYCDEREEQEDDCRREGGDEGDEAELCGGARGGRDDHCGSREDSGNTHVSRIVHQQAPLFTAFAWNARQDKRNNGLLNLSALHRTVRREQQPPQVQQVLLDRAEHSCSPCGSADWFTTQANDLPIQAQWTQNLPSAAALVGEVGAADQKNNDDDDLSNGWFSDEEDNALLQAPLFTATGPYATDMNIVHRPVPTTIQVSRGREM